MPQVRNLIISFNSSKLKELCEKEKVATDLLGPKAAKNLRSRIKDLEEVDNIYELPACRPIEFEHTCQIKLTDDIFLTLMQNFPDIETSDFIYDWNEVYRVKIVRIHNVE